MSKTVEQVGQMNLTGNIIPANWFKTLRFPNGKPHVNAILVLSDIVYWYRPIEIRDELTGQFRGFRKKFSKDKLQRSYSAIAELFGLSKRQVKEAMDFLEDEKRIIIREFRTVDTEAGRLNNVLFIDLNIEELHKATYDETYPLLRSNAGGSYVQTDHPPAFQRGTNTEITTEIKKDRLIDSEIQAHAQEQLSSKPEPKGNGMPITDSDAVQSEILPRDWFEKVEQHYLVRRGGLFLAGKDSQVITEVLTEGIPVETIIAGIDRAFDTYEAKYPTDKIRAFSYCATVIRQMHYEKAEREKALRNVEQFVPGEAKPISKAPGGRRGYKNQRKDEIPPLIREQLERQKQVAAGEAIQPTSQITDEEAERKRQRVQQMLAAMGEKKA